MRWRQGKAAHQAAAVTTAADDPAWSPTLPQQPSTLEATRQAPSPVLEVLGPEESAKEVESERLPPSILDRFDNLQFLGRGGMGTVYRGFDKQLARDVAIKFVHSHDAGRFLREARAQARINHDNVCKIYDVGLADGQPYITMQLVHGQPLDVACKEMTLEEKIRVIRAAASALHEAHRLGLVHRDVKPANIMVEKADDVGFHPFVMDFGLARMAGERGETMTGQIAGTPAYMAPEQARGEIRTLDRRTDVYSLGSTFYDILANRPPFVEDTVWKVLMRISTEDAPPLKSVCSTVPADLETIVMKCLERDPARRYDSARALGDDLQRYLDGEPISAKRSSLRYVLWKKARKHKLALTLGAIVLLIMLVPLGAWIRSRKEMAIGMELSRSLGEDLKTMEFYLRAAHELPLHDVERERNVIRARIGDIERRMNAAGQAGLGPGHYAMGRGYLALGELENARSQLEASKAAGYASSELEYAIGRVLGELYKEGIEQSKRLPEGEVREKRLRELETQLRTPALEHLRAAGAGVESPMYAEGLIAFYEGKYDVALIKAREAFDAAPLMYEAKKLEGDVHYALGNKYRYDAQFDWDRMMEHYRPAVEAYRVALDIARSDPDVHQADCELHVQIAFGILSKGSPGQAAFDEADASCARGVQASSKQSGALVWRAILHMNFAFGTTQGEIHGDPSSRIAKAIELSSSAVEKFPDEAMSHYVQAGTRFVAGQYGLRRSLDTETTLAQSIAAYESALRIDPNLSWARAELGVTYASKLVLESWRGQDTGPSLQKGLEYIEELIAAAPTAPFPWNNKGELYRCASEAVFESGRSPVETVTQAVAAYQHFGRSSPDSYMADSNIADTLVTLARHELRTGSDPNKTIDDILAKIAQANALGGHSVNLNVAAGRAHLVRAAYLLGNGKDPTQSLDEALGLFRRAAEISADTTTISADLTQAQNMDLRWAILQRNATAEMFDATLAPWQTLLSEKIANPSIPLTVAETHLLYAQWLLDQQKNPTNELKKGFGLVDVAFKRNPRYARAFALRGDLHRIEALAASDPTKREQSARKAKQAFDEALRLNTFLTRETQTARQQVDQLLESRTP